jgi:hypothetical protein
MFLKRQSPMSKHYGSDMNLLDIEGVWNLLEPIQADMDLVQLGDAVRGTYKNSEVKGTIEGTLIGGEEGSILAGKWSDQLGEGSFRVIFGMVTSPGEISRVGKMFFYGNWKHSKSEDWNGIFEGIKR